MMKNKETDAVQERRCSGLCYFLSDFFCFLAKIQYKVPVQMHRAPTAAKIALAAMLAERMKTSAAR